MLSTKNKYLVICLLQPSWVSDEEFGMGYLELKPAPGPTQKSSAANQSTLQNGAIIHASPGESAGGRTAAVGRACDGKSERTESASLKPDMGHAKQNAPSSNGSDSTSSRPSAVQSGASRSMENQKHADDLANEPLEESNTKAVAKTFSNQEV